MTARLALAAALLLAGCGGEEPATLIPDFAARSDIVECRPLAGETIGLSSITSVRSVSDSTLLAVDGQGRQVVVLDGDVRVLSRLEFPAEGPGSVARLLDAAASGDSLLVIADGGRNRLLGLTQSGEQLWMLDADFPPQSVSFAGGRLLVAALGLDPRIRGLLHEQQGRRLVPLGVPFIPHQDGLARMFVNSVGLHGRADGSAIAAHELVWPRAWIIPATGDARRVNVPVPSILAGQIGFVPTMPMREEDLDDILAPVISLTVDPASGDLFYVTRAGGRQDGRSEKAIVRASSDFAYLASVRLPVNAVKVAYLERHPDSLIVADYDLGWHRCPVPPRPGTASN